MGVEVTVGSVGVSGALLSVGVLVTVLDFDVVAAGVLEVAEGLELVDFLEEVLFFLEEVSPEGVEDDLFDDTLPSLALTSSKTLPPWVVQGLS